MATRKQKRRQARRTRKQRGGAQAFVRIEGKPLKTMSNATNKTTPRNLLQFLIEQYNLPKTSPYSRASQNEMINPAWQINSMNYNNKWNTPFGDIENREFKFRVNSRKLKNERIESIRTTSEILKRIFELPEFQKGAKIITESFAVDKKYKKNINQQFKFTRLPFSPILLVDFGFFSHDKNNNSGDFFKYLDFEKVYPDLGPSDLVGCYKKEAGKRLQINSTYPSISEDEKKGYLAEVLRQAEIGLSRTKQLKEGQSAESFLQEKELFICCLRRDNYLNKNTSSALSLLRLIPESLKEKTPIYGWSVNEGTH